MLYSNADIRAAMENNSISITPLGEDAVQPSSVDVRLGRWLWIPDQPPVIDPYEPLGGYYVDLDDGPHEMPALSYLLGVTIEKFQTSNTGAVQLGGKSSLARIGMVPHLAAGFVDPGFCGPITLELFNHNWSSRFRLYQGMPIGQVQIIGLQTPATDLYSGRYSGGYENDRPVPSRYWEGRSPS